MVKLILYFYRKDSLKRLIILPTRLFLLEGKTSVCTFIKIKIFFKKQAAKFVTIGHVPIFWGGWMTADFCISTANEKSRFWLFRSLLFEIWEEKDSLVKEKLTPRNKKFFEMAIGRISWRVCSFFNLLHYLLGTRWFGMKSSINSYSRPISPRSSWLWVLDIFFYTPIPCSYTSLPLVGVARNFFLSLFLSTWICRTMQFVMSGSLYVSYPLCPRREKTIWSELRLNPGPLASQATILTTRP